jgi:4-hydroxybenzoate polyprenyltransferase
MIPANRRTEEGIVLKGLLVSMRPKQWPKNLFIFAGLVFDEKLFNPPLFLKTALAFVLFCLISSSVYLINDLTDLEHDRKHPKKRNRPLASGQLHPRWATLAAVLFPAISLPACFVLKPELGWIALVYFVSMLTYSLYLKHLVIIDVLVIAAGFVLRVMAGTVIAEVARFSPWLYICTLLGALFIGFAKRRHEILLLNDRATQHRAILGEYTPNLLDQMIIVVTSTTIMAYCLYTFSAPNLPDNHAMMLTIPFVLYGVFRYLYLIHVRNEGGSPEEILIKDVPFIVNICLWILASVIVLYRM